MTARYHCLTCRLAHYCGGMLKALDCKHYKKEGKE